MASERPAESLRARSIASPVAVIVVCAIALTFLGLTILFSASVSLKQDPYFYLDKQVVGVAAAVLLCFVASRINLDYARRASVWIAARRSPSRPRPRPPPGRLGQGEPPLARLRGGPPPGLGVREAGDGVLPGPLPGPQPDADRRPEAGLSSIRSASSALPGSSSSSPISARPPSRSRSGLILLFLAGAKWRYIAPDDRPVRRGLRRPRRAQPEPAAALHGVHGRRGQQAGRHLPALPVA
jgi:cell division protein FtsW